MTCCDVCRNAASQKPSSSRATSPVRRGTAQPQNRNQGSGQAAVLMQPSSGMTDAPAPQMPYRSAFMGGHMIGTRMYPCHPLSSQNCVILTNL